MNEMKVPQGEWLNEFFEEFQPSKFCPVAYYDKHLDCIRVEIRDCSITEHRCGEFFTVLEDNYPQSDLDQTQYIGFSIKGIRHVFEELELPLEGIQRVVEILDRLAKQYPNELVEEALEEVRPILNNTELSVDFAEAA